MADPQTPVASGKAPITAPTLARAGVVAGGIAAGPQLIVPLIHQWDLVHYAADKMPDAITNGPSRPLFLQWRHWFRRY